MGLNLLQDYKDIQGNIDRLNKSLRVMERRMKEPRKPVVTVNCDTWRILRTATEDDNRSARRRIVDRIKNAFWL